MNQTHPVLRGACHCGAVQAELRLGRPVEDIPVRACQCGFCRRHGAANVSDAAGALTLRSRIRLTRYRFASGATQVLLCPVCGVYVGGMIEAEGQRLATLNVAGLDVRGVAHDERGHFNRRRCCEYRAGVIRLRQ